MRNIKSFITPMDHCETSVNQLLKELKVNFTKTTPQKHLIEHPDYPSMMAIADVLGLIYNISSLPIRINAKDILMEKEIKTPFLAQIRTNDQSHEVFAVVTIIDDKSVEFFDPSTSSKKTLLFSQFEEIYNNNILVVHKNENSIEENYSYNLKKEKRNNLLDITFVLLLPTIATLVSTYYLITANNITGVLSIIFIVLTLLGSLISVILVWNEIDMFNPIIQQFCKPSKSINCSAVLDSKGSKIFGFSWSSIGVVYFMGMFISLLVGGQSINTINLLSWINLAALLYIFYSIYYQWKIVKQWCLFCLYIQIILIVLSIVPLTTDIYRNSSLLTIPIETYFTVFSSFSIVITVLIILLPALEKTKIGKQANIDLQKLKYNPRIFNALLKSEGPTIFPDERMGITIGNPQSIIKIIKVCNPYCGPCAKAHNEIHKLLENNDDLCMQIIFNSTGEGKDITTTPVLHFLTINAINDKRLTNNMLNDWYNLPKKDYQTFALKYPVIEDINSSKKHILNMRNWCNETKIEFTPTIFICFNTKEENPLLFKLPKEYNVYDLKYLLTV